MPSGMSLEITGLQELAAYAMQLSSTFRNILLVQLSEIFDVAANRARSDCPVRTGFLKKSIAVNKSASGSILIQINITAKYAGFVNFGTHKMKPRPFATNAYNLILSEMSRINLRGT